MIIDISRSIGICLISYTLRIRISPLFQLTESSLFAVFGGTTESFEVDPISFPPKAGRYTGEPLSDFGVRTAEPDAAEPSVSFGVERMMGTLRELPATLGVERRRAAALASASMSFALCADQRNPKKA
jgi:hypothetical protein